MPTTFDKYLQDHNTINYEYKMYRIELTKIDNSNLNIEKYYGDFPKELKLHMSVGRIYLIDLSDDKTIDNFR